jgi:hypothetical protein
MSKTSLRRRPRPATVIGLLALFLALGGTAEALHGHNKVKADDIAKGAVRTGAIRNGAVTVRKANLLRTASIGPANATTSTSATGLGGPAVKVTVPRGALVEVFAEAQMAVTGNNTARIDLFAPRVFSGAPGILATQSHTLQGRRTAPGPGADAGTVSPSRAGYLTFAPPAGHYVFALAYETSGGTATFQNRALFVRVIR